MTDTFEKANAVSGMVEFYKEGDTLPPIESDEVLEVGKDSLHMRESILISQCPDLVDLSLMFSVDFSQTLLQEPGIALRIDNTIQALSALESELTSLGLTVVNSRKWRFNARSLFRILTENVPRYSELVSMVCRLPKKAQVA